MSSRESPMNLGSDDSDDEINAAYFREEVIYCALMKRWQHIALLYSELPKEHGPGRSTTSTPMEKLVNYARKALYAEGNGRTNLHVIPPFWQPSDDLYLLLSFLELGDVAYCNPDYFSRRFSIADRKLRLNAILENEVLRRRVIQTTQMLTRETRCRIKSRIFFSEDMETMMRFLIRDVDDDVMCKALGTFWSIDKLIIRGHFAFLRSVVDRRTVTGELRRSALPLLYLKRERIVASAYMKTHLSVLNLGGLLRKYIYDG